MDMDSGTSTERSALQPLARVGFFAKGIVYVLIGWLAFQLAIGSGGRTTGTQGALQTLRGLPAGDILLVLVGIGLIAYALWRLAQAAWDPENESEGDGAEGAAKRIGYGISGLVYGALGLSVFFAFGSGGGGSAGVIGSLLENSWGRWLVGFAGVVLVGTGLFQFKKAAEASFMSKLSTHKQWVKRAGQLGFAARGVVYIVIGVLTIVAAVQLQPQETGGIDQALATLASQPYGQWLLGAVALGLVLYGVYALTLVKYRDVRPR